MNYNQYIRMLYADALIVTELMCLVLRKKSRLSLRMIYHLEISLTALLSSVNLLASTLQRLPFYCTPPAAADAIISDPSPKDLAASHVAKRIRSALAQSSGSTTRHSLFVGDSDDESDGDDVDACVEILLVTSVGI
ncbi:hypothetical protein Tco_1375509 [Tanacetum coccineum]